MVRQDDGWRLSPKVTLMMLSIPYFGGAIGFVQSLKAGVYIAINGKYFDHDKVEKNPDTGEFVSIQ